MARLRPAARGPGRRGAAPDAPATGAGGAAPSLSARPLHAALEALDLTGGVHDVLGAGVEGMAIRADLDADRLGGRPDREGGTAPDAVHLRLMVLRMNLGFHDWLLGLQLAARPAAARW